jgi:Ca-activated chloride channel family protein
MIPFAHPLWLLVGLFACLGAALFIRTNILRRQKELRHFAAPHLLAGLTSNVSLSRRRLKNIFFLLALVCLFAALARPQYGNRWIEVRRKGIDILIGVDVSKSMLVQDIKPDRLQRAKLAIRDFVGKLEGDRVGLLPFAGTAFPMCPLTTDYEAFNASLNALDVNTIPKGGTDLGVAIREAGKVLVNEANHKIFILVTDGEDLSEEALQAAAEAEKEKMTIYTIGVGTPEGELIPIPGRGDSRFAKDSSGNFVTSKLDQQTLTKIAETTGGLYVPLGSMGQGFDTVYQQKLTLIPKEEHAQRKRKVPIERFPWPLGAAVFLLAADFLLTGRKSSWALRLPFIKTAGRRTKQQAGILVLLLLAAGWFSPAQASEGEKLFHAGAFDQAVQYYQESLKKDTANPALHFNLGDSLYRKEAYEQAITEFNEAIKTDDLAMQARSYYNRGNCRYNIGSKTEQTDPEHTISQWQQAVESFQAALKLDPEDKEAAHNLELVKKKLEQLQEQQEQKKSGQQCDNPQNKGKKGDKDKDKKDSKDGKDGKQDKNKNRDQKQQDKKNKAGDKQSQQDQQQKNGQEKEQKQDKKQADSKGSKADQQKDQAQDQAKDQAAGKQDKAKAEQKKKNATVEPPADKKKEEEKKAAQAAAQGQKKDPADKDKQQGAAPGLSKQDQERRLLGKMTEEEAKNLLNSLKGEQGELNFIPRGTEPQDDDGRDW